MSNQRPNYTELLPALRRAVAVALSDAEHQRGQPLEHKVSDADRDGEVFADLWMALLSAVLKQRDTEGTDLALLLASVIKAQAGIELVPVLGTVTGKAPDGGLRVRWDDAGSGRDGLF